MNRGLRTIGRDLGRILEALAALVLVSVVVPVIWREWWAVPAVVASGLLPLAVGRLLERAFTDAPEPGRLHGMMIAASGWLLVAAFGSIPFLLVAWTAKLDPAILAVPTRFTQPGTDAFSTLAAFRNPLNGLFESMSGFTGTGLTMAVHEDSLPHTLQWWRSFSEWIGGVGVIVLTTAILARPGSGSLTLYQSEARSEKIHPSIVSTVRTIWWIFLLFTFVAILALWLAGMPLWHAINHAMTALATGGFSVTDNSIATYDSPLIDFVLLPVMVAGSIAFPVHYLVLRGDLENPLTDLQTRWVFGFFTVGSALLTAFLVTQGVYEATNAVTFLGVTMTGQTAAVFQSIRYGVFQFVSAASCTGFQTAGSLGTAWSAQSQLTVAFAMVVGAAAGSTAGGIKLVRLATLVKGTRFRIRGIFYPSTAVRTLRLGDRRLTDTETAREFEEAAIITFLWFVFLAVGALALMLTVPMGGDAYTLENVLFEIASAQGNVGLSTGITGPGMPTVAKIMFLFNMWIGRLEIIPVLVLLRSVLAAGGRD